MKLSTKKVLSDILFVMLLFFIIFALFQLFFNPNVYKHIPEDIFLYSWIEQANSIVKSIASDFSFIEKKFSSIFESIMSI